MSEKSLERLAMEAAEQVYRDTGTQEARVAWEKAQWDWFGTAEGQDALKAEGEHERAEFYAERSLLYALARSEDPADRKQAAISAFEPDLLMGLVTDPDNDVSKHAIRRLLEFR